MLRTAVAAASVAFLIALPAASADAVWARPSTAPLTDAAGDANGCTASMDPLLVGRYGAGARPPLSTQFPITLTCPASADVHRMTIAVTVFEVMPDGTKSVVIGPGEFARAGYGAPLDGSTGGSSYLQCPDRAQHIYLSRAVVKTKHSNTDTDPHIAKVDRLQTVSCR